MLDQYEDKAVPASLVVDAANQFEEFVKDKHIEIVYSVIFADLTDKD